MNRLDGLTKKVRVAKARAAEDAAIAGIPPHLKAILDKAQAEHAVKGGCPGCGHMVLAVHYGRCPTLEGDIY